MKNYLGIAAAAGLLLVTASRAGAAETAWNEMHHGNHALDFHGYVRSSAGGAISDGDVMPQFIAPGDPVALTTAKLASVHVGVSFVWLVGVSCFVGYARQWLTRPGVRRGVGAASGLAIAAFGVKLALSKG